MSEYTPRMQHELVAQSLALEADFLDDLGEHDEASAVRARIVTNEEGQR
jgi:hypothetical protein